MSTEEMLAVDADDDFDAGDDLGGQPQTGTYVEAHPGIRQGVREIVPWKTVFFLLVVIVASALAIFFTLESKEQFECLVPDAADPALWSDYREKDRVSACRQNCQRRPVNADDLQSATIEQILVENGTALLMWKDGKTAITFSDDLKGIYHDGDKWQMMIVAILMILFVSLVLSGAPPELTLFFCGAVAVVTGGLDANKLYLGTSSSAVVTLAFLFPIMKAMADTGIPDIFIGKMMGQPKTLRPAIIRMFIPVALLSGLFNNTPIVVMMIPLVMTFCQRLNLDHRAMLMPLSYASQAGGSLTLMGTSINFVAQEVFAKGGFTISFFTLSLGGAVIAVLILIYCAVMAPILLATTKRDFPAEEATQDTPAALSSSGISLPVTRTATSKAGRSLAAVQQDLGMKNLFSVTILITPGSPLVGSVVQDCGIHRIKGVHIVHRVFRKGEFGSVETGAGSFVELEQSLQQFASSPRAAGASRGNSDGDAETNRSVSAIIAQYGLIAEGWEQVQSTSLQEQDVLQVAGTSEGIAQLRQVRGLVLGNEHTELAYLGGRRRQRVLCEAAVVAELVGKQVDIRRWKSELRCGVIGIRSMAEPSLCRLSYQDYVIQAGDVLLIEGFRSMIGSDAWIGHFGVVRQVRDSAPPRNGRKADLFRAIFTGIGLLCVVGLATLGNERLTMPVMCTIFLTGIIVAKGLTLEEAYGEINARVLFTIVGALGLGEAMKQTRLANCMAVVIVSPLKPLDSPSAILIGMYVATVGVGQFLNSAANVAIMGSIGIPIASQMEMPLANIALVITYAASACYMAPYGYQTNTLVLKDGGYTWGDFIKFGGTLQLAHMALVVFISPLCADMLT